jgi:diguanylate cyclase (GGDEF)-like protein
VPLLAQGEALGVLYFCAHPNGGSKRTRKAMTSQARMLFYLNFAETLALALANIRLRESLQHQAIRDPLTNLFNRRYMQETLAREIQRVARSEEPLAIVTVDIDHFKQFNDKFGHDAGDEVLKTVADILQNRTRAGDLACRCGGEEFTLVYPGMSSEIAVGRVEAIRHDVETREFTFLGKTLGPVTISAGIAVYPTHAMEMESLLHAADQALYQSKRAGRNRGTLAAAPVRTGAAETAQIKLVHSVPTLGVNRSVVGE